MGINSRDGLYSRTFIVPKSRTFIISEDIGDLDEYIGDFDLGINDERYPLKNYSDLFKHAEPEPEAAAQSVQNVFPISYKAYGNSYSFYGYKIETDDNGNTKITMSGSGFAIMSFRNGRWAFPAGCVAESGGNQFSPTAIGTAAGELSFIFDTYFSPEKITLTNGDTGEVLVSFNIDF